MARTKGAKNKPKYQLDTTLKSTEMGDFSVFETNLGSAKNIQTSAEYTQVETLNTLDNESITDGYYPLPQKKKRHRRTKAEMEAYRASLKAQKQSQDDNQVNLPTEESKPLEATKDTKNYNDFNSEISSTHKPETSVGVVSTPEINSENYINNVEVEKKTENEEKQVKEIKPKKSKQTKTTYPLCDCCQQEIYCQPHRIDTNILSAQVADYFRVSPRWVNLCSACAKKLSDVVDNWLQENGCITRMKQRMLERENKENKGE